MTTITTGSNLLVRQRRSEQSAVVESTTRSEDVRFGPIAGWTVLMTTLVLFLGVGVPMWQLTGQVWDGIGLGAFTAVWGGPGFGVMIAGAIWTARTEGH